MRVRGTEIWLRTIAAAVFACSAVAVASQDAQDRATVHLRDGTRVDGRIEALADGVLVLRGWRDDERRFPVAEVALIERHHGDLPDAERREARAAVHILRFVGGSSVTGRLLGIKSGEGSGEDRPKTYIFRTFDGQERHYQQSDVARIYLGSPPLRARSKATSVGSLTARAIPSAAVSILPAEDRAAISRSSP